jgi:hypothetical protein
MRTPGWAVRAIGETGEAFILIPAKPSMHRLTRDVDPARHLNDRDAPSRITASTA